MNRIIHRKILLLWSIVIDARVGESVMRTGMMRRVKQVASVFLQVVRLADVQGVSEHELPQAPQCVGHGPVGPFAPQPVARQVALLLFGQVGVPPLCCWTERTRV